MTILRRGLLVWLLLLTVESLHGIARRMFLEPHLGDFRARQVAVFTGSVLILTIAFLCARWIGATTKGQLLGVGGLWLVLTVTFEILLGRVMGLSWERIGSDYNPFRGGLMPIGLILLTLAPLLAARLLRGPGSGRSAPAIDFMNPGLGSTARAAGGRSGDRRPRES